MHEPTLRVQAADRTFTRVSMLYSQNVRKRAKFL